MPLEFFEYLSQYNPDLILPLFSQIIGPLYFIICLSLFFFNSYFLLILKYLKLKHLISFAICANHAISCISSKRFGSK